MVGTGLLIDQEDRLRDMGLMNCGGAGERGCWGAGVLGCWGAGCWGAGVLRGWGI
jgi:hypothetical protein